MSSQSPPLPRSPAPRVVVNRRVEQAGDFADKLTAAGFTPILFPTIELVAMDKRPLDNALSQIQTFDWLIFSSTNAVDFFFRRVDALQLQPIWPRIAVVGSATAARLAQQYLTPDFMPTEFVGEALAAGLGDLTGQRVLLPRAKAGRPELVTNLQAQGADVVEVGLYETKTAVSTPSAEQTIEQGYEVITFASPSSVDGFMSRPDRFQKPVRSGHKTIACIGPITAAAAEKHGLHVTITPAEYTIEGLVAALVQHFDKVTGTFEVPVT